VKDAELDQRSKRRWNQAIKFSILAVVTLGVAALTARKWYVATEMCCGSSCIANLKQIEGAKGTWALENRKDLNAIPTDTDLFGVNKYFREKPICPQGGTYTIGSVAEKPRCSIPGHTI